jgi:hypothetical protein
VIRKSDKVTTMGQTGSQPLDGFDLMKKQEFKLDVLQLNAEEAEATWNAVDEKKEGVVSGEQIKKLFDGLANKFVEKIEAANKDKIDKLKSTSTKKGEEEKKMAGLRQAIKEEFTCKPTVTYFCRAARMAGDKLKKEQYVATAQAGGKLKAHEKFEWSTFNQYKAPDKSEQAAPTENKATQLTATEKAQLALRQQKQQLLSRDDSADKLNKEVRAAQVDRLQELFKKCERPESKERALDSATDLRSLIQLWYLPSRDEVDSVMKQFEGKQAVNCEDYLKGLKAVHPADMKIEERLTKELTAQFDAVASTEGKTVPLEKIREMVYSSYLAPPQLVDKMVAVLDPENKGKVSMPRLVDAFPELEKAFPDVFGRLKAAEEAKIRATRAALEALERPPEKKDKKKEAAKAEAPKEAAKAEGAKS